ncbi:Sid 2 [Operophtera brumata]|uniref:Sid 2 n=1 Tax=Operophtera brumata TaxID=104452 RepID=A0A0L7L423_OPEBR|nr:Sid 2 [Operophtera brumata]
MLVQTPHSVQQFSNISRTLCPHNNMFAEDEDTCETPGLNTPIVHLTSSSPDPIRVNITVDTVKDFYIQLNATTRLHSTPSQPMYYFYPFDQTKNRLVDLSAQTVKRKHMYYESSNPDAARGWTARAKSVILLIESDDDICALVSIQNFSCPVFDNERDILYDGYYLTMTRRGGITLTCPVFDNERDILYDGYYLTMTRRGGITLTQDTFPIGFYIVFIVKTSDEDCSDSVASNGSVSSVAHYFGWGNGGQREVPTGDGRARSKLYLWNVLTVAVFYTLPVIQLVVTYQRLLNQSGNQDLCYFNFLCAHPLLVLSDFNHVYSNLGYILLGFLFLCRVWRRHAAHRAKGDAEHFGLLYAMGVALVSEGLLSAAYHVCPNSMNFQFGESLPLRAAVRDGRGAGERGPAVRRVPRLSQQHELPHFGLLYAMGVALVSEGLLSAAYHVCPNSMNFQFGESLPLRPAYAMGVALVSEGLLSAASVSHCHFGLLYAMGVALVSEGLLSAAYHVCPNSMNFQFGESLPLRAAVRDGRGAVLCMVKIYQSRHPDINARAHATFGVLALIIFVGLVGVLNANLYFWVAFTALHLVTCLVMTFQIYYLGRFKLDADVVWRAARELAARPLLAITPTHCGRCVLLLTPAQSRRNNSVCSLLQLYDSHDIWHFMSSVAMFLSFNMYLTLDDNLSTVPRSDIMVF